MKNETLVLDYNLCETIIRVTSDNDVIGQVVRDYFYPYVSEELPENVRPEVTVSIHLDDTLFHRLQDNYNTRINEWVISLCRTEKGTYRLIEYAYQEEGRLLKAQKTDFIVIEKGGEYEVFVKSDYVSNGKPNDDLYHLFEHVISKKAAAKGYVLLHASSVAIGGKAFLFIGKKRTGKTTTFFEACIRNGAVPLSVDKTYVKAVGSGLLMACHPSPLRVLAGTLRKYEGGFMDVVPEQYRCASSEELWKGNGDGKVRMGLHRLEEFIGRRAATSASVACLVFPYIHYDRPDRLTPLTDPDHIAGALRENLFTPHNPEEDWWSRIGLEEIDRIAEMTDRTILRMSAARSYRLESADAISLLISEAASEIC